MMVIYKITNLNTKDFYIGSAINFNRRVSQLLKEWISIKEAPQALGISHSNLSNTLRLNTSKHRETAGGFKWRYKT